MTDNLDDTRPRPVYQPPPPPRDYHANEIPAPPRFLFWAVIAIFVLGVLGIMGGVLVFRSVLEPAQQERVMSIFPFMEAFLPPRPPTDATLPTPIATGNISPEDLLTIPLTIPEAASATPTAIVTEVIATATPLPFTPTIAPTLTLPPPTLQATVEATPQAARPQNTYPANALLTGINYQKQTWNNCGPANITMALSFFGWQRDQHYAAQYLKPGGREDKNVSPHEMVDFVNNYSQLRALTRMGGTLDLIKSLISNNIPVIIETGYWIEGSDWLGHYQTIVGYDDNIGNFYIYDSNFGQNFVEGYIYLDENWQYFNRRFIVVYEPQREDLVMSLLGDHADEQQAAQIAAQTAQDSAVTNPQNAITWFNLGTSLTALGDYERASVAFDRARQLENLPWRIMWYQFEAYTAYYNVGRYEEVLSLAEINITNSRQYLEEAFYWKGRALAAMGRTTEAASAFRQALARNPDFTNASVALDELN
ncbi:MAG: tetratricopeptide repeat protein [Anaerolineae bacterium]|jgi:hypothetical protein|nr:tetratricopeptide repeat protein [Anaerolineae bacterium]